MLNLFLFLLPVAFAKTISAPYLNFNLPDTYNCEVHDGYYQCQDTTGPRMKDSIFVATFKRIGPQDSTEQFLSLLSKPFTRMNPSGPPSLSQVVAAAKKTQIKNWEWVTAKHFESDLSNYYTYYWATTRGSVAMVVKYSVLKKSDQARQADIQMIAQSLETKNVAFSPPTQANPSAVGTGLASPEAVPAPTAMPAAGPAGFVQRLMNIPPAQKYLLAVMFIVVVVLVFYAMAKPKKRR